MRRAKSKRSLISKRIPKLAKLANKQMRRGTLSRSAVRTAKVITQQGGGGILPGPGPVPGPAPRPGRELLPGGGR